MEFLPDRAAKKAHHWAKQGWQFTGIRFKRMRKSSLVGMEPASSVRQGTDDYGPTRYSSELHQRRETGEGQ
jgi:hypothetical protein